jgi:predicted Zn finger-like uncharacterized protein
MSLATRCTSCGTAFRVVQDQLKVSEGWVRCGRCDAVFNALEGLFDLQREPATQSSAASHEATADDAAAGAGAEGTTEAQDDTAASTAVDGSAAPVSAASAQSQATEARWGQASAEPASEPSTKAMSRPSAHLASGASASEPPEHAASLDEEIDAHLFGVRTFRRKTVPGHLSERDRLDFSDARFDSDLLADAADEDDEAGSAPTTRSPELPLESSAPHPEFLRRADSRARWQRPGVRAALGIAALTLLALLGLQAAHHFRNDVAARWPALEPALAQWCTAAGCRLEAPHRIDEIAVENTALAKLAGSEAFRLGVTLRSRSAMPLAMPWIDLSLTDANGRLVARRALAAAELEPATRVLQPGSEIALHAFLEAANSRVTGYTIEIFYP